jgi:hypothetical protein
MVTIFLAGLATWIITSTIVEAEVFRDVREACDKVHNKYNNWWTYKLRYLLHCHMCTGIWVSAIIALFIPAFISGGIVGWGLTAFAIKGIGHSFLVLQKLFETVSNHRNAEAEMLTVHIAEREAWKHNQNVNDVD